MKLKIIYTLVFAFIYVLPTQAQQFRYKKCGTEFTPEMETRLLRNIATANRLNLHQRNGTITYVATKFHLVADNNGNGRISRKEVLDGLCNLNQRFADQDIVFYLAGMYDMNITVVNNHSNITAAQFQMSVRKNQHPDALNIFVCNSLNLSTATTLSYYSPHYDIIAITKSEMGSNSSRLTHEVGHYLSLPHPFNGWGAYVYGPSNLPPTTINGIPVELADGSNCTVAGDYFCDTPPDYNQSWLVQGCVDNLGTVDPTGAVIDPDETLYMSYYDESCRNRFTAEQTAAMTADIQNRQNIIVFPSNVNEVNATTTLILPADLATDVCYDYAELTWQPVPNATKYLLQISRLPNFSTIEVEVELTNTTYFADLSPTTNYYWRVKAYNETSVCANITSSRTFTTNQISCFVNTSNNVIVTNLKIQPSIIQNNQSLNVNIETAKKINATIRIVNITGQVVKMIDNLTFQVGEHNYFIETNDLSSGTYVLNLQTKEGQISERFIITN